MKVVIVLDKNLPLGLLANSAAVLAFSVSRHLPGGVGHDLEDADGGVHPGITNLPIPILACEGDQLGGLRERARSLPEVTCVDFSHVAQRAKRYDEYAAALKASRAGELEYLGICVCG